MKYNCDYCTKETENETQDTEQEDGKAHDLHICDDCQSVIDDLGAEVCRAYLDCSGAGDLSDCAEAYQGQYKDDQDFAMSLAEDLGELPKNNSWPHYCIDWEYAARELMMDYFESDGHYFRNL